MIQQGEIYWVDFEDPAGSGTGYRRPCIVIQNNLFNASKINTVIVCIITSNLALAKAPGNILLKKGKGGLPKDSVANVSQIITLDKTDLQEKVGQLGKSTINDIVNGIKLFIEPKEIV